MASKKYHCNLCMLETNHEVLFFHEDSWSEELGDSGEGYLPFHGWDKYTFACCQGCDSFKFVHDSWNVSQDEPYASSYPSAISRGMPKWLTGESGLRFIMSQTFIPTLIRQVYGAYHSGSYALAAMGIRSLVEQVMIDKVGDHGAFAKNIAELEGQGYISKIQGEFLRKTIEMGHAAIHRGHEPTAEDIRRSLDIAEPILETIYIHEGHANLLEKSVPERKSKSESGRQ